MGERLRFHPVVSTDLREATSIPRPEGPKQVSPSMKIVLSSGKDYFF